MADSFHGGADIHAIDYRPGCDLLGLCRGLCSLLLAGELGGWGQHEVDGVSFGDLVFGNVQTRCNMATELAVDERERE